MILSLLLANPAVAQGLPIPAVSPRAEVMQEVGVVEIRVNYASPAKRDRVIWGELVPFGELWRTGANAATTLSVSAPVSIGGTTVEAGKYALFTIPSEESWTIILNSNADQGGTGSYTEDLDVLRLDVKPQMGGELERLTFSFHDTTASETSLDLAWDGVQVSIPIEVDTGKMMDDAVAAYISGSSRRLASAARHYSRSGEHDKAQDAIDAALRIEDNWYNLWTKAEAYRAADDRRQALRYAKKAQRAGKAAESDGGSFPKFYAERIDKALTDWRKG
ncbi:MAG: DUF2911 domain-containing protein [Myxococcota bacterium]